MQTELGRYKTEREMGSPRLREPNMSSVVRRERRPGFKKRNEFVHKKMAEEGGLEQFFAPLFVLECVDGLWGTGSCPWYSYLYREALILASEPIPPPPIWKY